MEEQSLKDKTVKGTFWSAADTFLAQGVSFIVGLVLARLLSPDEYGLIGIVTIFMSVMIGVIESGFRNALIRKQETTEEDYSTLFVFNLVMSVIMFVALYLVAPWIARFFEQPVLVSLIRVMGVVLIFQALSIVQDTILTKRIDFKTKTKASVISAVFSGVIGIIMAFKGFGVWSLVAQHISRQLLYTGCLWIFNKWWPKNRFSIVSLKYMWGFGWKLLLSGLLENIWRELNKVVVGKYYSPASLGQYTRAEQYASLFSSNINTVVQRVTFPVLAEMQGDKVRMTNGYRRIIKITMFITAILMISLGAVADPLIYCLIGPQWHQAASFLPLICINMSFYPLHAINLNMLQVQGRSDIFLILEIIKKIIAIGPICMGVFLNIYWMLIGCIITGIISFFLNSYYTGRSLGYSSWMQLKDILPGYGIAFIIAFAVYFFKYLPISYWIVLPIQIIVGSLVLFAVCELSKLPAYSDTKEIVWGFIRGAFMK